ncbi:hypothetical protein [Streptomyces barkulensis]|uniref:hypothetical protein n=1 Tax=Streptomyces barkulensis TaxID=1257026 RepID=UPI001F100446|nr:hypothetical protein [Streptomyces barkulensis]
MPAPPTESPNCSPGSRRPCPYGRMSRASSCRRQCGGAGSAERLAANASWCRTCQALVDAPKGAAGGPWVLLHRSEPERELSTWTYPTEKNALHHGAHLAMTYLQLDDGPLDRVALDLFTCQAHVQVIDRFLELHPETTQFEVAELVSMRANEF